MENEWKSIGRYFTACTKRFLFSKHYIAYLILAFICAVFSINFLDAVYQTTSFMPNEVFESFKSGKVYNFGLLTVSQLDYINTKYFDEILMGILSGSFVHCMLAISVSTFIGSESKSGYLVIAITHGQKRVLLFNQYILCSVISVVPLVVVTLSGTLLSLLLNGMVVFENVAIIIKTILLQFIMLSVLCICIASIAFLIQGYKSVILCVSGVLILPLMPNYIKIFTRGKIDLNPVMLLNLLVNSGTMYESSILNSILISVMTAILFYAVCMLSFRNRSLK